jgi:hypothetical protein
MNELFAKFESLIFIWKILDEFLNWLIVHGAKDGRQEGIFELLMSHSIRVSLVHCVKGLNKPCSSDLLKDTFSIKVLRLLFMVCLDAYDEVLVSLFYLC